MNCFEKLADLANLCPNWDDDDAIVPTAATREKAKNALQAVRAAAGSAWFEPSVCPCPEGEIDLYWDALDREPGGWWYLVSVEPEAGRFFLVHGFSEEAPVGRYVEGVEAVVEGYTFVARGGVDVES